MSLDDLCANVRGHSRTGLEAMPSGLRGQVHSEQGTQVRAGKEVRGAHKSKLPVGPVNVGGLTGAGGA